MCCSIVSVSLQWWSVSGTELSTTTTLRTMTRSKCNKTFEHSSHWQFGKNKLERLSLSLSSIFSLVQQLNAIAGRLLATLKNIRQGRECLLKGISTIDLLVITAFYMENIIFLLERRSTVVPSPSVCVPWTSCLTGLESAVWQLTIFAFICKTD
jgi:hypothetical protein